MSSTPVTYDKTDEFKKDPESDSSSSNFSVGKQLEIEAGNEIRYRTCSWQKTAGLLFSEYICLAILSFPWSYSVLGLVPGVIVTIAVAVGVWYTSLILWKFCLKHPDVRDVCDVALKLTGGNRFIYHATAVMFIGNNVMIQALHCLVGAKLLNTLTGHSICSVAFFAITAIICFVFSLPRTLGQLSGIGTFAAVTMAIAVFLAIIFSGIQEHPFGYTDALGPPIVRLWPAPGTTFVAGLSGFLNISYTFIGQICLPSFIAEMEKPKDFPKALAAVTICEIVVFTLCGAIMYHYVGEQYMTAPAFGSLQLPYKKIAFSFAIPTIIYLGSLYSVVTARFLIQRIFPADSVHLTSNTVKGWSIWTSIVAVSWIAAWVISEVIPFFSDLLSLMTSLFDCWFGYVFWGFAYLALYPGSAKWAGPLRTAETLLNYGIILFGLFTLVAGTYASVQSIIDSYAAQAVGGVFKCTSNGI